MGERVMSIEEAIRAMIVDELPKARGRGAFGAPGFGKAAWSGVAAFGELMTIVDENMYGLAPSNEEGAPHPDAVALWRAVEAFGVGAVTNLDWYTPFAPDEVAVSTDVDVAVTRASAEAMAALIATDEEGDLVMVHPLSREVVRFALRMDPEPARVRFEAVARANRDGSTGWERPVEVMVFDDSGRARPRVTYQPGTPPRNAARAAKEGWRKAVEVRPDPGPILRARLRHALAVAMFAALSEDVADLHGAEHPDEAWEGVGDRRRWRIGPPRVAAQPWLDRDRVTWRVPSPSRVLAVRKIGRKVFHQVATADLREMQ